MQVYLPEEDNSLYYNSKTFQKILKYLKSNFQNCEMTEKKGKLSIKIQNVKSIKETLIICQEII